MNVERREPQVRRCYKLVAYLMLLVLLVSAAPVLASNDVPKASSEFAIQVKDEDKIDLNGDGTVSMQESQLLASYRMALKARDAYVAYAQANGEEPTDETLALITPKDPSSVAPENYDSETIRNVLMNLWARWEYTWFQAEFLLKFAVLGGGVAATNAFRNQWNRAGVLLQNLIGWSYLTSDVIRIQFTNMMRSAGYNSTIANRVGVVMKQFVEWLCNHPEWFD